MFAGQRREAILDSLIKNRKVNVLELSKEFAVSQVIIRKDLKLLEAEGKLQRTHGGAIEKRKIALNTTFEDRKIINEEEKMVIAKKAYELINDNDVILMDISTINFMIARLLEEKPKRITIITQSLDLIVVLSSINEINIISLGGSFDKKNRAFLGRITSSNIKKINPLKCFLGAGGINIDRGNLSNYEEEDGEIKREFISVSKEVYLLAEHQKFVEDALYNFTTLEDINYIISDNKLTNEELLKLEKYFITVI